MARKSKQQMAREAVETARQAEWRVGAYLRLSVENSGNKTVDTIENQQAAVLALIDTQHNMRLHDIYCDNGETGTDFDRPAFDRLMNDLRGGVINCVVVKDLSRFGRNYLETGTLLEQTFPSMGVRFVAIQDGFDTLTAQRSAEGYVVPLRNILNDIYAKDISLKAGSALRIKQQQGNFIGTWAAYGYQKDARNKHRLVVDESAAAVVRQIFVWKAQGMGNQAIARGLSQQGVASPSAYRYRLGLVKQNHFSAVPWRANTIKAILQNQIYLGHMVQGCKRTSLYLSQKQRRLPQEEWTVVRDTHPAIVEQALFDEVQRVLQERAEAYRAQQFEHVPRTENAPPSENSLRGLLVCGRCGSKLTRHKHRNRQKNGTYHYYYQYICPNYDVNCIFKGVSDKAVWSILEQAVRVQLDVLAESRKLVVKQNALSDTSAVQKDALSRLIVVRKKERETCVASLARGEIAPAKFAERQRECKTEIERLKTERCALDKVQNATAVQAGYSWETLADEDLAKVVQMLVKKIVVDVDGALEVTFGYADAFGTVKGAEIA